MRVATVLLAASVAFASAQEAQQRPTFRGGARFVRVDVYPTDGAGKPIEGLTAADFELYEDGRPQTIDTFDFVRIEPEPEAVRVDPNSQLEGEALAKDPRARVFAVVLDTRHVDIASGRDLRRPLVQMLDRLIGPRDMFGVITPQLPASSFLLGRRSTTVADMMARHWVWGAYDNILPQDGTEQLFDSCYGPVTMSASGPRDRLDPDLTRELIARHRERETLEHLSGLVDTLQAIREERKVAIIVTQGWRLFGANRAGVEKVGQLGKGRMPQMTNRGGRIQTGVPPQRAEDQDYVECAAQATALLAMDSRRTFRDLAIKAARANVAFYPLDPRGLAPFDQPISHGVIPLEEERARLTNRAEGLRELAINTDGMALIMNNDLDAQFRTLSAALSAYYLLGYYSTNTTFDGKYRRLEVKVKKPGVQVKARRGYVAPTEAEIKAIAEGREAAARPPDAGAAALSEALGRLAALTHSRDLFLLAARVPGAIVIHAELGVNARTARAWADGGEVRVTVTTAGGEVVETRAIEPLRSGVSLRVPIADPGGVNVDVRARAKTPGAASAAEATLVVPAPSPALIGDLLAYRGLARALQPAADGRYRRTERATIEAPLAAGVTPAGARVLDRTGRPLNVSIRTRERVDASGVRWMAADAVLAPLTDGDYVIELEVMKDDARERRLFAIRVVR